MLPTAVLIMLTIWLKHKKGTIHKSTQSGVRWGLIGDLCYKFVRRPWKWHLLTILLPIPFSNIPWKNAPFFLLVRQTMTKQSSATALTYYSATALGCITRLQKYIYVSTCVVCYNNKPINGLLLTFMRKQWQIQNVFLKSIAISLLLLIFSDKATNQVFLKFFENELIFC